MLRTKVKMPKDCGWDINLTFIGPHVHIDKINLQYIK